jgi:hypothetical protein
VWGRRSAPAARAALLAAAAGGVAGAAHRTVSDGPFDGRLALLVAAFVIAGTAAGRLTGTAPRTPARGPDRRRGSPAAAFLLGAHTLAALGTTVLQHQTEEQTGTLPHVLGHLVATVVTSVVYRPGTGRMYAWPAPARMRVSTRRAEGRRPDGVLAHVVVRRGPPGHGFVPLVP